jgi:ABC-2 type transport system ATP-binding protein
MAIIEVSNLCKTYRVAERRPGMLGALSGLVRRRSRTVEALRGVSFSVESGEMVAYIGPNGAGKSTTVKIMAGILTPSAGACTVAGRVPWRDRAAHVAGIGVVFGQRSQLWWDLPVGESFDLLRAVFRRDPTRHRQMRDELVAMLALEPVLATPVRQLSLGQRMRCELVAALLHEPQVLFLDEPTIGLDAVSKLAVRSFIRRLNAERGVTVILTTHDMDDIEAVCDRVLVIGNGQLLSDGSLAALRDEVVRERRLIVDLPEDAPPLEIPGVRLVRREGGRQELAFDPFERAPADLIATVAARQPVRDLLVEHPPIEEVIAALYRRHDLLEGAMS